MAYVKKPYREERKLLCEYKGYPIFKDITKEYKLSYGGYYDNTTIVNQIEYFVCGVKGGNINKSSDRYSYCSASLEEIKRAVDRIENGEIILTDKEVQDWVLKPNAKSEWGFSTKTLLALMKSYKKANPRRRMGYLERLTDANFHTECSALEDENYAEFERLAKEIGKY